ncbi:MAG: haloacid dehalogenase type II [Acidimicrobiia bacterium]
MPALVCDVNETLLDLAPLAPILDRHLGPGAGPLWFARLLHHSTVTSLVGDHRPFGELGAAAFSSVAQSRRVEPPDGAWDEVAAAFSSLPAHLDVVPGLGRFRAAGWTVATLTNSAPAALSGGLAAAGLVDLVDVPMTVEAVGRFKPAPEPYLHALSELGVAPDDAWMVACHDWDLAGAAAVGMHTAFVTRPGMPRSPAYPPPDVVVADLVELADRLL